jgi:hypothetical protein
MARRRRDFINRLFALENQDLQLRAKPSSMNRGDMFGKHGFATERHVLAIWTSPFSPMILKFMDEPFVPAAKHSEVVFFESAHIRLQVTKDMLPVFL